VEHPHSPHAQARDLVDALFERRISHDAFIEALGTLQARLENGFGKLEALLPGDDCPEAVEVVTAAADALRDAWAGLESLRALTVETNLDDDGLADGDSEAPAEPPRDTAEVALEQIRLATEAMIALVGVTEQNTAALEAWSGSLLEEMFG